MVRYDGTQLVQGLLPQLTTVRQPIEKIAKTAVLKLIDLINDPSTVKKEEITLPVKLLVNSTT